MKNGIQELIIESFKLRTRICLSYILTTGNISSHIFICFYLLHKWILDNLASGQTLSLTHVPSQSIAFFMRPKSVHHFLWTHSMLWNLFRIAQWWKTAWRIHVSELAGWAMLFYALLTYTKHHIANTQPLNKIPNPVRYINIYWTYDSVICNFSSPNHLAFTIIRND